VIQNPQKTPGCRHGKHEGTTTDGEDVDVEDDVIFAMRPFLPRLQLLVSETSRQEAKRAEKATPTERNVRKSANFLIFFLSQSVHNFSNYQTGRQTADNADRKTPSH